MILYANATEVLPAPLLQEVQKHWQGTLYVPPPRCLNSKRYDAYVSIIIRFTLLAPDIIHAVLAGKINKSIITEKLKQALPPMWEDQKKMFEIE